MNLSRMTVMLLCGFGGSVAVEVVMLYQHFQSEPMQIPERYRRFGFWVVRFFMAVIGGGLALAYEIDKPLLAANIGAATPLIIKAVAELRQPQQAALLEAPSVPAPKAAKARNGKNAKATNGNGNAAVAENQAQPAPAPAIQLPSINN